MLKHIASLVKQKRELSSLDDQIVLEKVQKLLQQDRKLREKIERAQSFAQLSRGKEFKEFVKRVRAELRSVYGVFDLDEKNERGKLLQQLRKEPGNEVIIKKLLSLHQSSKERLHYYKEIYKKIFAITGEPKRMLDLGCGANPYAYRYMGCKPFYTAIDLPSEDLNDIASFFEIEKVDGEALGLDLAKKYEKLDEFTRKESFDVALLFKLLDSLEETKRNVSGKFLDSINATWLVVSFPTMSLGGKKHIRKEKRAWFEKLLQRRGWWHESFEVGDEVFSVVLRRPDIIAEGYYERHGPKLVEHYNAFDLSLQLEEFTARLEGKAVIDIGSGGGRDAEWLSHQGYKVTGVDQSTSLLEIAKKRAPKAVFKKASVLALPFRDQSFDGAWAVTIFVHMYDSEVLKALQECSRVLKSSGFMFLSEKIGENNIEERLGEKIFFRQFTEEQLRSLLTKAGFTVIQQKRVKKRTFTGMGIVIEILAKKA